jgi:hypothetical protein
MALLNLLVTLIILPIELFFGWLMSLLFNQGEPETRGPLQPLLPDPMLIPQNEPIPWVELIKSIIFWIVFIGVVGISLIHYFKENQMVWEKLRRIIFIAALVSFLRRIGDLMSGASRQLSSVVEVGLQRLKS